MVDVKQISKLVRKHFQIRGKGTFTVNPHTGEVDAVGDVIFKGLDISQGMFHVQFGTVKGDFVCYEKGVISLKGSPHTIHGDFFCFSNLLTDLEGGPRVVRGGFSCMHNKLTNLMGAPEQVGDWFSCYDNRLTSLQGAPRQVGGSFHCGSNKLISLEGGPNQVGDRYDCRYNPLKSFQGAPQQVGDYFDCDWKKNLSLLQLLTVHAKTVNMLGAPKQVSTIMNNHAGQGKPGAIKAAVELIRAGYKENARW